MIVYCCCDLIFATKVGSTAQALGYAARPARNLEALQRRLDRVDDGRPNDPVTAVMIDLELGPVGLELLDRTKAHDTAIPVVAFGSHVAVEVLEEARAAGADFVMPRSQFVTQLPALVQRFAGPRT